MQKRPVDGLVFFEPISILANGGYLFGSAFLIDCKWDSFISRLTR
jgi:hypothetical protein